MKRAIMLLWTALSMVAQTTFGDLDKLFENDRNQPGEEISAARMSGCLTTRLPVRWMGGFLGPSSRLIDPVVSP
jgi:hypothetical protein